MTSVTRPSGSRPFGRPGPWERLAPLAALLILFALGLGMEWSLESQNAVSRLFSTEVRQGVAQGDFVSLAEAAFAFALWLLWLCARLAVVFAAVLMAELLLVGPPKSWRVAGFALALNIAASLVFVLGAPAINRLLPLPAGFGPLVSLGPAELEAAFFLARLDERPRLSPGAPAGAPQA